MIRHVLRFALFSLLLSTPALAQASVDQARAFVDRVGGQALSTLKDENLSKEEQIAKLNTLFSHTVDIRYLSHIWRFL